MRRSRGWVAIAGAFALSLVLAAENLDFGFMPKGGRALLLEVMPLPKSAGELRFLAQEKHTDAEWHALVDQRWGKLGERERATLAAYLAVNIPITADGTPSGQMGSPTLPPDGRDLAWNECQSCHSLFSGYLTQSRDIQGWRSIFLSPFHRQMKLNQQEREEFARYAAINMPLKLEDIPQDLRF